MRKDDRRVLARLVLTVALVSCTVPGDAPDEPPGEVTLGADTGGANARPVPERPDSVRGTLRVEGVPQPMTFRLYRTPAGADLGFSTYLPAEMDVEEVSSGEGDAVRFVANFGGRRRPDAFLSVTVPPEPLNAAEARRLVRDVAGTLGESRRQDPPSLPWALEEYRFAGSEGVRRVALGRHAGRYFYVTIGYPVEMGDGMAPRVHHLLAEWRWRNGTRLGS